MAKIAFIGAGSVVFAKNLICDILQNPALEASTLCLMDVDAARLKVAEILARKVVAQLGVKAKVESTLDLRTACTGARYVITMIQVGGYKPATITDFEIPKKYGLRQTIGDTLGVGGVFRALRTMPELVRVGNALRDFGAPDPLFLNYSNPMAMNMMAIDRACGIPSVGLCHSVQGTSHQLAGYIGVPTADVTYKVAGINHVAFFLEFKYRGQDAYPLLFEALENPKIFAADKVRFEMMRRLGYFVTESSEHFSEYCPWFLHHGKKIVNEYGIPLDEYLRRCESIIATWKDTEKRMLADSKINIGKSVEYGARIINAIESGLPEVIYGNVPNSGLITNLPDGCCVEVPCLVDSQGVQPTVIGDLPAQLAAMCRSNIAVQELAVEAFLTGKREAIYHAVMMDPHTSSQLPLDSIWKMCDELIAAHQRDGFLPQFAPVRKNTGRSEASLARVLVSFEDMSSGSDEGTTKLELVIENRLATRFRGPLALKIDDEAFQLGRKPEISCNVAPGAVQRIPLKIRRKNSEAALVIDVVSDSPLVLARHFEQPRRQIVRAGQDPVRIEWSGNVVAQGRVSVEKSLLTLSLRVTDTDIQVSPVSFWDGSCIEIFLASAAATAARPEQIVCLPDPRKPRVFAPVDGKNIGGATARISADRGGYDAEVKIPLRGPVAGGLPVLIELLVHVNALGDAHGRVSAAWQGSPKPHLESRHFALLC
jgi:alpha-galactosidase